MLTLKTSSVLYLKFKLNWASCIPSSILDPVESSLATSPFVIALAALVTLWPCVRSGTHGLTWAPQRAHSGFPYLAVGDPYSLEPWHLTPAPSLRQIKTSSSNRGQGEPLSSLARLSNFALGSRQVSLG